MQNLDIIKQRLKEDGVWIRASHFETHCLQEEVEHIDLEIVQHDLVTVAGAPRRVLDT